MLRATSNSREEIGLANQVTSTAEQGQGVRTQSPGSTWKQGLTDVTGARGVATPMPRDNAGMNGLERKKKQPGVGPQETTISCIKISQTRRTQQDRGVARCDGTPSSKFFNAAQRRRRTRQCSKLGGSLGSRSSSTRPSRSLSRRKGRLDSEGGGDSSVAVH